MMTERSTVGVLRSSAFLFLLSSFLPLLNGMAWEKQILYKTSELIPCRGVLQLT